MVACLAASGSCEVTLNLRVSTDCFPGCPVPLPQLPTDADAGWGACLPELIDQVVTSFYQSFQRERSHCPFFLSPLADRMSPFILASSIDFDPFLLLFLQILRVFLGPYFLPHSEEMCPVYPSSYCRLTSSFPCCLQIFLKFFHMKKQTLP